MPSITTKLWPDVAAIPFIAPVNIGFAMTILPPLAFNLIPELSTAAAPSAIKIFTSLLFTKAMIFLLSLDAAIEVEVLPIVTSEFVALSNSTAPPLPPPAIVTGKQQ